MENANEGSCTSLMASQNLARNACLSCSHLVDRIPVLIDPCPSLVSHLLCKKKKKNVFILRYIKPV